MCPITCFRSSLNKHLTDTLNEILVVVDQSQRAGSEYVRFFIREKLAAAAEDIFVGFETALSEYQQEIERQRRLLDIVLKPQIKLHRTAPDSQHPIVCKEEPQEQNPQEKPETSMIKEEQDDARICEFPELEEADIKGSIKTFHVKSENDEEKGSSHPYSTQIKERSPSKKTDCEDCGLSEADSHLHQSGGSGALGKCQPLSTEWSETEAEIKDDWTDTGKPQSNVNALELQKTQGAKQHDFSDNSRSQKQKPMTHEWKSTKQKSSSVACKVCGESFPRKLSFISHVKIHSRGCGFCGKQFDSEQSLKLHSEIHGTCRICSKTFSTVGHLDKHMQVHNPQDITCAVCKRAFYDKTCLKTHMRCHTGEKPFRCTVCNKRFTQAGSIKRHMRCHTGEKPFRCTICDKGFTQAGTLKAHMRRHTGEKPFMCTVCEKGFTERANLTAHMKCHSGERPFMCTVCKKCFIAKGCLKIHMRIHTGERPFSCAVCNKTFKANRNLKNHMTQHSALEQFIGLASPYVTKAIDIF